MPILGLKDYLIAVFGYFIQPISYFNYVFLTVSANKQIQLMGKFSHISDYLIKIVSNFYAT